MAEKEDTKLFDDERIVPLMEAAGLDALFVTSRPNFTYLTGIYQNTESSFIAHQKFGAIAARQAAELDVTLVVPWVDHPFVSEKTWASKTVGWVQFGQKGATGSRVGWMDISEMAGDFPTAVANALRELGLTRAQIGIEESTLATGDLEEIRRLLPNATFVSAHGILEDARQVKTPEEVCRLRKSGAIMEAAFAALEDAHAEGLTEWDLTRIAQQTMLADRAERILFWDVGIGINSMTAHGEPTDRALRRGDVVRYDAGVSYKGYLSDIGRSYVLGEANDEHRRGHEACMRATDRTVGIMGPGVPIAEIYRAQVEELGHYFDDFPINFMGHGLGVEIHEQPFITSDSTERLEAGMVINIEPGAWIMGKWGLFFENTYLITEDGYEPVTTLDVKQLVTGV